MEVLFASTTKMTGLRPCTHKILLQISLQFLTSNSIYFTPFGISHSPFFSEMFPHFLKVLNVAQTVQPHFVCIQSSVTITGQKISWNSTESGVSFLGGFGTHWLWNIKTVSSNHDGVLTTEGAMVDQARFQQWLNRN